MRRLLLLTFVLFTSLVSIRCQTVDSLIASAPESTAGHLIVVGGGGTPKSVLERGVELAGGSPRVAVVPYASAREDRGDGSVEMWLEAGAKEAWNVEDLDEQAALEALATAELIWMPGGSQSRLMTALDEHGFLEPIRRAHAAGATVGGTSAGAAVMTSVMIAESPERLGFTRGRTPTGEGLGLFPGAIVDQHFIRRGRNTRLLQTVLDHPERVGFGIDERTALIAGPDGKVEIAGESHVLVYDARSAEVQIDENSGVQGAREVKLDVLRPGDRFEF